MNGVKTVAVGTCSLLLVGGACGRTSTAPTPTPSGAVLSISFLANPATYTPGSAVFPNCAEGTGAPLQQPIEFTAEEDEQIRETNGVGFTMLDYATTVTFADPPGNAFGMVNPLTSHISDFNTTSRFAPGLLFFPCGSDGRAASNLVLQAVNSVPHFDAGSNLCRWSCVTIGQAKDPKTGLQVVVKSKQVSIQIRDDRGNVATFTSPVGAFTGYPGL
jgi:hypothetical protein